MKSLWNFYTEINGLTNYTSTTKCAHMLLERVSITPFKMVNSNRRIAWAMSRKSPCSSHSIWNGHGNWLKHSAMKLCVFEKFTNLGVMQHQHTSMSMCPGCWRSSTTIGQIWSSLPISKPLLVPFWPPILASLMLLEQGTWKRFIDLVRNLLV